MSFKGEVRKFMADVRGELSGRKVLERQIDALRKQNEALMDRLMSQNLRDYKVHNLPIERPRERAPLGPLYDETMAGEMIDDLEG